MLEAATSGVIGPRQPRRGALRLAMGMSMILMLLASVAGAAPPARSPKPARASLPAGASEPASARYRLIGGLGSCAGAGASATGSVICESGFGATIARSSSDSADVIGGYIGQVYSSRGEFSIETVERSFASIAFVTRPTDSRVTSLFHELGAPNRKVWRLGHWSPRDSAYIEAAGGPLVSVQRGLGYFLITADSSEVEEVGLTPPVHDDELELEDGPGGRPAFNQLGNPFPFPVLVSSLQVSDGSRTVPLLSPDNTLTEASVKLYDPATGSYLSNSPFIDSQTAFWVKKLAPGPVRVIVPYLATENDERPELSKPPGARWALAVTLSQGARASEPLMLGAAPVAGGRWNSLCVSRAPAPPAGHLSLSFNESAWGRLSGDYVRVFRALADTSDWRFTAQGTTWPGEAALKFQAFDLPPGARIVLTDLENGSSRQVSTGETVTIATKPRQEFRIEIAGGDGPPDAKLADGLRYVYPNPLRRSAGLVFTLARGGMVEAKIYDVSGRHVRTLSAAHTGAGEHLLVWDGTDGNGRAVAPGVYLARYRAATSSGVARLVKLD